MKHWLAAFRLRTLPLALSCIVFGGALSIQEGHFNGLIFIFCVITTILLQILSNLANDYGDFQKGTDNDKRVGPTRAMQSGVIGVKQMKNAIIVFSLLSLCFGILLLYFAFGLEKLVYSLIFLALGLAAIWAAINYTAGKSAYGYKALGDVFVFLFFGLVGVLGSNFLFTQSFDIVNILPASACGLLAVAVLNLNNTRDILNDKASNKITIPVLIGLKWAKRYQIVLILTPYILLGCYAILTGMWGICLIILTSPISLTIIVSLMKGEGKELDPLLKKMAITTFFISLLFLLGTIVF